MIKLTKIGGVAALAFLLASCQDAENETTEDSVESVNETSQDETDVEDKEVPETEEDTDENSAEEDMEEDSSSDASDTKSDGKEETMASEYFIHSHTYSAETAFLTAYSIDRKDGLNSSKEERLKQSLIESDPSEQEILGTYTEMTAEWPELHVNFTEEGNILSTTTAQTGMFYDSLIGISDLFGIEQILFFNPDGEEDIIVAQSPIDEPIMIKEERGQTRGYYTIYDKDLEQTLFLPGGMLEEKAADESGEALSFSETIDAMKKVEKEEAFYGSAMIEGLEVVSASLEDGIAEVHYTVDDEIVTEDDQTVLENAIQLTALDFHAEELRLVNDTLEESKLYPLIGH
ncbi:hypothetical protein [Jeotgalibacillus campisalis]|uniref:GerMN domain-containing protein n=1 Tax=Jeotgalibacillus campisalis TaxID=220754 RepID=A0A0C2VBT6_9BACL|nr:hypothetical protein [Jeotgalibacillus campisalis]KIL46412.1 hypothetical protein KR50_30870 [Jeotgalibacillus campisalis]